MVILTDGHYGRLPPNYILHATAISATVPVACMTEMSKMSVTNTITLTVESVSLVALTNFMGSKCIPALLTV